MWPWTIHTTSLSLSVLICNYGNNNPYMGITIVKWLFWEFAIVNVKCRVQGCPLSPTHPSFIASASPKAPSRRPSWWSVSPLTSYSPPTYALTHLSAQLLGLHSFPHPISIQLCGFCLPNILSPFLQLYSYCPKFRSPPTLAYDNSNSLLTGILLPFASHPFPV